MYSNFPFPHLLLPLFTLQPKLQTKQVVYPKVKVRHDDDAELGLKAFLSLYLVTDHKVVSSTASMVKAPKCYVPHVTIPRVLVTEEDSGDFSSVSDSSGATESEKDDSTDENKVNIRASSIPRPHAVISSPDNYPMIGNRNKNRDGRLSSSKNGAVLQINMHTVKLNHMTLLMFLHTQENTGSLGLRINLMV